VYCYVSFAHLNSIIALLAFPVQVLMNIPPPLPEKRVNFVIEMLSEQYSPMMPRVSRFLPCGYITRYAPVTRRGYITRYAPVTRR